MRHERLHIRIINLQPESHAWEQTYIRGIWTRPKSPECCFKDPRPSVSRGRGDSQIDIDPDTLRIGIRILRVSGSMSICFRLMPIHANELNRVFWLRIEINCKRKKNQGKVRGRGVAGAKKQAKEITGGRGVKSWVLWSRKRSDPETQPYAPTRNSYPVRAGV